MIANNIIRGWLLIRLLLNFIVRCEAKIDGNNDANGNVRRRRKLIEQQEERNTSSSSSSNNINLSDFKSLDQTLLSFLSESSFGRQKVIEFMIEQYVSPETPDNTMADKLENAMEAMSFLETDAEPVQVVGYPFLFVGSVGASLNHKSLQEKGITHVINWSSTARCNVFDDIEYMCIDGIRGGQGMQEHTDVLEKAVEYVESVRLAGGKVLSHCWYGRNRSVTLLEAYLMKYEGMKATEANDLLLNSRPEADPYWGALHEYSRKYLRSVNKDTPSSSSSIRARNSSTKKSRKKTIPNVHWKDEDQS